MSRPRFPPCTLNERLVLCVSAEKALQSLLEKLTCPPFTPTQHLEREQALAKQFAEILHFTLRFDELKVCCEPSNTHTLM